jgi:6-phosphogluconolactonase
VVQCGIGPDCHTASLFPGEPLIDDREGLVASVEVAKLHQSRITMLPRILLNAKNLIVLASGPDKARPLCQAIREPYDPKQFPAQLLFHDRCNIDLFADSAAAGNLR